MIRSNLVLLFVAVLAAACSRAGGDEAESVNAGKPAAAEAVVDKAEATPVAAAVVAPQEAEHNAACGSEKGEHAAGNGTCGQAGSACNQWDEQALAVTNRAMPAEAVWRTFEVDGMHCGGCERRVIAKVGELEGVVSVKADAGVGEVRVAVSPGQEASLDAVADRINSLGYRVQ